MNIYIYIYAFKFDKILFYIALIYFIFYEETFKRYLQNKNSSNMKISNILTSTSNISTSKYEDTININSFTAIIHFC